LHNIKKQVKNNIDINYMINFTISKHNIMVKSFTILSSLIILLGCQSFIKYIDDRILKEKKNNITSRKAEYEKPPIGEKEADIVFMVDVYHHIENRKDYFSLVKKGLKPNGEMVIVDFKKGDFEHGPPNEMKIHQLDIINEMKLSGFKLVTQDTTTLKYQYMLKFK